MKSMKQCWVVLGLLVAGAMWTLAAMTGAAPQSSATQPAEGADPITTQPATPSSYVRENLVTEVGRRDGVISVTIKDPAQATQLSVNELMLAALATQSATQPATNSSTQAGPVDTVAAEIALRHKLELEPLPVPEQSDYFFSEEDLYAHFALPNGPGRQFGERVLDESPYPSKPVKVTFIPPANVKQVRGWVKVMIESHERRLPDQLLKVKDNSITMNLPDDAGFRLDISCLPGVYLYMPSFGPEDWHGINWTDGKGIRLITLADGARQVEMPLEPAGAIAYQVKMEDGTPVKIKELFILDTHREGLGIEDDAGRIHWVGRSYGPRLQVLISKLPIGKPFVVNSSHDILMGYLVAPAQLTAENPAQEVTRVVSPGRTYIVQVLDLKGRPAGRIMAVAVQLDAQGKIVKEDLIHSSAQGQFQLEHVDLAANQSLVLMIGGLPGVMWEMVKLDLDHPLLTVQQRAGLHLKGRLVDNATGRPILQEELWIKPLHAVPSSILFPFAEEKVVTNDQGEFEFSTLSPNAFQVHSMDLQGFTGADVDMANPPEKPIEVRVKSISGKRGRWRLGENP